MTVGKPADERKPRRRAAGTRGAAAAARTRGRRERPPLSSELSAVPTPAGASTEPVPPENGAAEQNERPPESPAFPDILPVLPLHGVVLMPLALLPLVVGQERSVRLIDEVMRGDRMLTMVAQRGEPRAEAEPGDLFDIGTVGIIHQLQRAPDGTIRLLVQGIERIRVVEYTATEPFLVGRLERYPDEIGAGVEIEGLQRAVVDLFRRLVELSEDLPSEIGAAIQSLTDPRQILYLALSSMPATAVVRQELLELNPLRAKLTRLIELLQHEVSVRELSRKITDETRERMTKAQREFFLREQARAIQKELGEEDTPEIADLRRRLDEAGLSDEARREADRELERLITVPPASPEHGIIRSYLDSVASLPWNKLTGREIDIARARDVLDADHYDLEKVKDRILEYLAVRKLRAERAAVADTEAAEAGSERPVGVATPDSVPPDATHTRGAEPILCFVGPPGVGKTSLGLSIARSLGRKFLRISLGGVHDEAEIRGHRRTYVGAMPGRIIQGLRRVEARDPVFMLDEIDKVGADWRGDPSSALLEVLDPAQNSAFVDNYLNVAFDLSQVLFVATANNLDTISPPLRDRMEILQLNGYTDDEKVHIAERHLVAKQLEAHGLAPGELRFESDAIRAIVRGWTREAGVRGLDREMGTVCRKVARSIAEGNTEARVVTTGTVEEYLGRPRFYDEVTDRTERPGVATGLAWTPVGGDVLFVEATMMPGHDERLILTGQLGDVMRESAQAALSYLRASKNNGDAKIGIDAAALEGKVIHVHVPAGAIPKDGPSAGVTMLTALASLASGRRVQPHLAMTGELTLRGRVLPVGGIKEKILAAHRAGVTTVILPRRNERDLEDIPAELRSAMRFVPVDSADDVLANALESPDGSPRAHPARVKGRRTSAKRSAGANGAR